MQEAEWLWRLLLACRIARKRRTAASYWLPFYGVLRVIGLRTPVRLPLRRSRPATGEAGSDLQGLNGPENSPPTVSKAPAKRPRSSLMLQPHLSNNYINSGLAHIPRAVPRIIFTVPRFYQLGTPGILSHSQLFTGIRNHGT